MDWETPSFEEIDMSAEIGAYAPDNMARTETQRVETDTEQQHPEKSKS